jgi:hypothetical protein
MSAVIYHQACTVILAENDFRVIVSLSEVEN